MRNEQYASQGETYVLKEDLSSDNHFSPVVIEVVKRKTRQPLQRNSRSYKNKSSYGSCWVKLFGQWFYIPIWFQRVVAVLWDRVKLICITAIASHILFTKLPLLLRFLQP